MATTTSAGNSSPYWGTPAQSAADSAGSPTTTTTPTSTTSSSQTPGYDPYANRAEQPPTSLPDLYGDDTGATAQERTSPMQTSPTPTGQMQTSPSVLQHENTHVQYGGVGTAAQSVQSSPVPSSGTAGANEWPAGQTSQDSPGPKY